MIQNIIVILIVAAAAFYIGRMLWGALFGKGGCHSCSSNCGSRTPSKEKSVAVPSHLIQLQTAPPKKNGRSNGTAQPH
jgi:hypothetical protein